LSVNFLIRKKVKQSHFRPGQALRVPGGWGSQISWQSANEVGKVVSPTHRPPLLSENIPGTHFFRGWVNPRAIVWPKGLCTWKILMTPSGIKPATFRLVEQCLNQLCHQQRAPFQFYVLQTIVQLLLATYLVTFPHSLRYMRCLLVIAFRIARFRYYETELI
jgi:hypothetical protein